MTRVFVAVLGVLLVTLLILAGGWIIGQLLSGLGAFVVGVVAVLAGLLKFLVLAGVLGGLVYFVTSSWRQPKP